MKVIRMNTQIWKKNISRAAAVVVERLLEAYASAEIMTATPAIKHLIHESKTHQMMKAIQIRNDIRYTKPKPTFSRIIPKEDNYLRASLRAKH
jgi:Tfp pilus assembly pilus retraction ATPase PilT